MIIATEPYLSVFILALSQVLSLHIAEKLRSYSAEVIENAHAIFNRTNKLENLSASHFLIDFATVSVSGQGYFMWDKELPRSGRSLEFLPAANLNLNYFWRACGMNLKRYDFSQLLLKIILLEKKSSKKYQIFRG